MFDKNDKQLKTVRTIRLVCAIIFAVLGVIGGIIVCVGGGILLGILLLLLTPFLSWLAWVFGSLILTFLCDVKLIRNKLYGLDNGNLSEFITQESAAPAQPVRTEPAGQKPLSGSDGYENLLKLKKLYDSGALSQEEYEKMKREFLDR